MSKKLPILIAAAFMLLVSAALGFVNKSKIAAKQEDLDKNRGMAKSAQAEAATAKTKQKKAEKDASDAVSKSTDLQTQLTAATTQVTALSGQVDETKKNVDAKEAEIQRLSKTIADGFNNGSKPAAPAPGDAEKAKEMDIQLAEMKAVKDQMDSKLKVAENQVITLRQQIAKRENGESMNGLSGRVLAVNRDWNFVILSLGGRSGVNSNATMIIQRGGSTVGKVRVTSVEPSQSIADIVPNSVPAGINVQPGDTVVYAGM